MVFVYEDFVGIAASVLPSGRYLYLAGGVAASIAFILLSKRSTCGLAHKGGVPLPPGPPTKWIWESPFPKEDAARALTALVDQYGPVISLRHGSHVTVVIGRMDAATEIMEKEGGALVDRPRIYIAAELVAQPEGINILLESAGERFRRLRRALHTHLQPKAAETYEEIQAEAAKDAILDILNDPKQYMQHVQRYAAAVILRVTYGKTSPTSNNDPEVLKEFHRYELALFRDQLNRVRKDMATDNAGPSFGKTLLEHTGDHRLSDDEMAYLAGALFGAGSDTTAIGIIIMIMAAACHPDAQARVQEELDEIVGRDRVPTFTDKEVLPQLQAFMLEALRWRPVAILGFPHRATKDIIWRGQCIPAGATVLGCHWAISRDPVVFPDPDTFNPGRWLTEDGWLRTDMHFYTYGFGRRICPGLHIANRSMYINLALLLWSFRILQRPDAPIDLTRGFRDPISFRPEPFEVEFFPRMEERRLRGLMG